MYEKYLVRIPEDTEGISIKKIKGADYVYYTYDRVYDSVKKHTKPLNKTIGKVGGTWKDVSQRHILQVLFGSGTP